jgi:DNA-binding transcriptional ArsR family regulator
MNKERALTAFAALSQETRLDVFRLLIKAGSEGIIAGDIGVHLGIRQNTMSANLSVLSHAGLIHSVREGRSIRYFSNINGVKGLLKFLLEDCCGGRPELCQPVIEKIACFCGS